MLRSTTAWLSPPLRVRNDSERQMLHAGVALPQLLGVAALKEYGSNSFGARRFR